MAHSEVDTLKAIRARLERRRAELESQINQLQQELQEIDDVVVSLTRAPSLLQKAVSLDPPPPPKVPEIVHSKSKRGHKTGITIALRSVLAAWNGKTGDRIDTALLQLELQRKNYQISPSILYKYLRREADIKSSYIMFIKNDGFFLARD